MPTDRLDNTRREEILDVAAEIFGKKGYRAATLNDVAKAMGFTRAALYYYFENKQEMLAALSDMAGLHLMTQLDKRLAEDGTTLDKVRGILLDHASAFIRQPRLFSVFQAEVSELPTAARQRLESGERAYIGAIASLLEVGMDEGTFARRPAKPSALAMVGMANSVARWYRPQAGLSAKEVGELIVDLCVGGLTTPSALS
ncbi:MAG: TetR/AcrR family transcriptional regulator [Acidimicrobiales bacterium]|nr:TetR/AcrR family transcriptional regulator [Acidimicrobiales bacterium]